MAFRFSVLRLFLAWAAVSLGGLNAQVVTTGIYDAASQANAVDAEGSGNTYLWAAFTSDVATAYSANQGGVIDFETGTVDALEFTATFGASSAKTLAFSNALPPTPTGWTISTSPAGRTPVSGTRALSDNNSNLSFAFTLGPITGGGAQERVVGLGFTVLSRSTTLSGVPINLGNVEAVAFFSGGGSHSSARVIDGGRELEDTFFGFTAPTNEWITGFTLSTPGGFTSLDDLGFITGTVAIPEPSTWALAVLGGGCLAVVLLRRRGTLRPSPIRA